MKILHVCILEISSFVLLASSSSFCMFKVLPLFFALLLARIFFFCWSLYCFCYAYFILAVCDPFLVFLILLFVRLTPSLITLCFFSFLVSCLLLVYFFMYPFLFTSYLCFSILFHQLLPSCFFVCLIYLLA